jgi:hypothetical protein
MSNPVNTMASVPPAPGSMPAHFMTPQAPYSADPPGMAVTAGKVIAGRPAMSWAAALMACGLFVGVAAVAVMQSSDAVADTTASFVDPSRAPVKNMAMQIPAAAPTPVPVNLQGIPTDPSAVNGVIGASPVPVAPPVLAPPVAADPAGGGVASFGGIGFAPPAGQPQPPSGAGFAAAPKRPAPPPARPAAGGGGGRPAAGGGARVADRSGDDEKPAKPKPSKRSDTDDETRKALDALQKAQLESAGSLSKE